MKIVLFMLATFLTLVSCGGFEFVYKTNKNIFLLKDFTSISTDGDAASEIHVILVDMIGNNFEDPKYKISLNSKKTETASVITKDATASQFNIKYEIGYDLYSVNKGCKIYSKEIKTSTFYNARSDCYSFGTELYQKESSSQVIEKNINNFLSSLESIQSLRCIKN